MKTKIKLIITCNYDEMSRIAADMISAQIKKKSDSTIGLATGSTPLKLYQYLIEEFNKGNLDFSKITTFNLDEYYPIKPTHHQSYHYFMTNKLFSKINIPSENINLLNGQTTNVKITCSKYENKIKDLGGIDLQLLGIGENGHLAFNEPGSKVNSRTRLVDLQKTTIRANSRFFKSIKEVPTKAISVGLGTIIEAKKIIILASGQKKAMAIKKTLTEPKTEKNPASILQDHNNCTLIVDKEAASLINQS